MRTYLHISIAAIALALFLSVCGDSDAVLAQSGQSRAGLVLQFQDGTTRTYCIAFEGDSISGLDLLLKSGLEVKAQAYGGLGAEICQIGSSGCDYPNQACACQSYAPGGPYWSYFHLKNGQWQTSVTGAGSYKVHNGDVEGWAFSAGKPPTLSTFSQLCAEPLPPSPPTNTPQPPTPTPRPPLPTATHRPLATSTPRRSTATARPGPPAATPEVVASAPTTTALQLATPTIILTPTATVRATATSTTQPTERATATPTAISTQPPASATPTIQSATATPSPLAGKPEETARNVGLLIGAVVAGSLAVWGAATVVGKMMRSRGSKGGTDVE